MKNILIPTDFSENSWNAITYALSFFEKTSCNFYLLHVSPLKKTASNGFSYELKRNIPENILAAGAEKNHELLLKRIGRLPLNARHNFFSITENMFFTEAIRKQVFEKNIDFIVMGTKGASGLKGTIIGTNTADVITKVKCPVLVIPEKATYVKPVEIAFPTDYNIFYNTRVLKTISKTMNMHDAALRILHITKKEQELTTAQNKNKEFLNDHLKDKEHSFHFLTNKDIEAAVQFFVESRGINMIAMVAKNLNFFQRILFHPTVQEISYHTEIPFLVLHE